MRETPNPSAQPGLRRAALLSEGRQAAGLTQLVDDETEAR